jgi:group II intron reverse transcriptase/maturase
MSDCFLNIGRLRAAFGCVKENLGGPGVDQVTIVQFESQLAANLFAIWRELKEGLYRPLPLLKILVDKGNGEARALCIPPVRDRGVQTAILHLIEPILEMEFEDCSFGYRRGRSVKQAAQRIREYHEEGYTWVIDADIDAFFGNVDNDLLLEKVKRFIHQEDILHLIELWLKAEIWDGLSLTTARIGIPQGSSLSPILDNLFLDELDEAFKGRGCRLIRYADDFIVLCKSPQEAWIASKITHEILAGLYLALDEEAVVSFD